MSKELQKDEFYLKGDLGTIKEANSGKVANIDKVVYNKVSGCVTLTISSNPFLLTEIPKTEDAEFEIIASKQIEK